MTRGQAGPSVAGVKKGLSGILRSAVPSGGDDEIAEKSGNFIVFAMGVCDTK
jgi:hypothetical protein